MKPSPLISLTRPCAAATCLATCILSGFQQAHATDLYWDINGATANTGTTAGGNWNGSTANWNTDSTGGAGGSTTAATTTGDNVFFSSGTGLTGSFTVNLSGTRSANSLFFQEGTVTLSTSSGNATLQLGADSEINVASGRTATIAGSSSGGTAPAFTTVTGVLLSGTNGFTKTGAGVLILGNTYYPSLTGTISVKAGALAAGSASSNFGTMNGQAISLGDTTGSASATFSVNRNQNYNSNLTVNAGSSGVKRISGGPGLSAIQQPSITGSITLNDDVTLGNGTAAIYSTNVGGVRLSGAITGSKKITVDGTNAFTTPQDYTTNINSGTLAVTQAKISANNSATFTGNVAVERGALVIENSGSIGNGTAVVTTATNGVLNLNGQSPAIAGLNNGSSTGGSVSNLGTAIAAATSTSILTLKGSGSYSYGGLIQDGTYTGSSEWKVGLTVDLGSGGSQTLTGANTYTGNTLVSAGTLYVNGSLGNTAVSVGSSGTIAGSGSIAGTLSFADGGKLEVNLADPLFVSGAVTFANFGFDDLVGFDVETAALGTHTLLAGSNFNFTNVQNFGLANAYTRLDGALAYFESGSLAVTIVSVPEPSALLLSSLGTFVVLRRRRR